MDLPLRLLKCVGAWLTAGDASIRAAKIAAAVALLAAVIGPLLTYYLSRPDPPHVLPFSVYGNEAWCPTMAKLTPEQQQRFKDYRYVTIVNLPNDTGRPLLNVVVTIPVSGIAEVVAGRDRSWVVDFDGRVTLPVIGPLETTKVLVWHKEDLPSEGNIVVASPNLTNAEYDLSTRHYLAADGYRRAFYLMLCVSLVLAACLAAVSWRLFSGMRRSRAPLQYAVPQAA